jgi:D-alanine-D-alanine ligase
MNIAIITGGESGERDISIRSAENVKLVIGFAETETFIFPEDRDKFLAVHNGFDIAIPIIHGAGGEDGTLQKFLGDLGLPYIFSGPEAHAIGIDKKKTKELAESIGIKTAKEIKTLPLFAKPRFGGSSVASGLCSREQDVDELVSNNPNTEFLTEELIKGREFTVGVIESNGKTIALPVIEIIPKGEFFDFENKYDPAKLASEVCPADIGEDLARELKRQALEVHNKISAKHISRSDFMMTHDGEMYFLEINTIPGMTKTSLIPKMLQTAGMNLREWLKELISTVI